MLPVVLLTLTAWKLRGREALHPMEDGEQLNLQGGPLQPCTPPDADTQTGYTGSGSCEWEENDYGYHEVCVTMSDDFLSNSSYYDNNDLTSVTEAGSNWCICAWAWASAVERDPENYEGLDLVCESTNSKLREVYETQANLTSPSGYTYESQAALEAVDELCPASGKGREIHAFEKSRPAGGVSVCATRGAPRSEVCRRAAVLSRSGERRRRRALVQICEKKCSFSQIAGYSGLRSGYVQPSRVPRRGAS